VTGLFRLLLCLRSRVGLLLREQRMGGNTPGRSLTTCLMPFDALLESAAVHAT
jgi:hypothetical protein